MYCLTGNLALRIRSQILCPRLPNIVFQAMFGNLKFPKKCEEKSTCETEVILIVS